MENGRFLGMVNRYERTSRTNKMGGKIVFFFFLSKKFYETIVTINNVIRRYNRGIYVYSRS